MSSVFTRESPAAFRTLIEMSRDPFYVISPAAGFRLIYANPAAIEFMGYPRETLLSMTVPDWDLTFSLGQIEGLWQDVRRQGNTVFTTSVRKRSGEIVPLEVTMNHLVIGDEEFMAGHFYDITERKQLETELKERFEVYQTAINTPALGFWLVDMQGAFLEINDAYVRQSGYSREELLRLTIPDVDAFERPEDTAARIETIKQAGYARFETQHRRKDGSVWPVEVITSLSRIQGGRFFVFIEDLTDRKRVKEALERANEELEARVERRTAELLAAKDEAERASKAKSEFLSTMSHELRTPLNAILGYSQLMQLQPDANPSQRENLGEILKAGRHLLELINQVLDLAKVESGHVDLAIENVECRPLLEDCLRLIRPTAQTRSIELHLLPDALPARLYVRADLMRLRQVLLNLVSNAVKYNRQGGQVRIRLEAATEGRLRFSVQDTGAGIPSERQAELFQPFNRIEAQNSAVEGAGIGLVISRTLINAMGGEIGFKSRVGEGSTFWIDLPRVGRDDGVIPDAMSKALPVATYANPAGPPV